MTDTTSTTDNYTAEALSARWTAVYSPLLDSWAVSINGREPGDGGRMAAVLVMSRELAEHIAALHNAHLDGRILPGGTETVERFGYRITIDGELVAETPALRAQAEALVELHREKRAANCGWRGDAVLVRRWQHTTPFEPVEGQP
ncbi:hypothetical protein QQG74_09765 [Micromonospora sp. FIMYZ51]|uniref:hypothetical protein n=1 Tax=Micromonospora sp. FIMYZ51 TaxID=3051832 RepID=UPI00311F566A